MELMQHAAVHIEHLSFSYSEHSGVAYRDFSLEIADGDRFGLFGPNGAGKSTLMNLMTGIVRPQGGTIRLFGNDIHALPRTTINKLFGFVPQDFSFYQELSPVENMEFYGAWYGLSRQETKSVTNELLEVLGLGDVRHKAVDHFSGGMKRRINLAIAVMHKPRLLFLDEPTVGVDVQTRHAIIDYLKELNRAGMTLVYTSHQLAEAEDLCQNVALIDQAKIIAHDNLQTLYAAHQKDDLEGLFLQLTGKAFRDS
jgi:ABC-2 type transport system ATP-binding protein